MIQNFLSIWKRKLNKLHQKFFSQLPLQFGLYVHWKYIGLCFFLLCTLEVHKSSQNQSYVHWRYITTIFYCAIVPRGYIVHGRYIKTLIIKKNMYPAGTYVHTRCIKLFLRQVYLNITAITNQAAIPASMPTKTPLKKVFRDFFNPALSAPII